MAELLKTHRRSFRGDKNTQSRQSTTDTRTDRHEVSSGGERDRAFRSSETHPHEYSRSVSVIG